jgi:SAM-dependent methyltransferase
MFLRLVVGFSNLERCKLSPPNAYINSYRAILWRYQTLRGDRRSRVYDDDIPQQAEEAYDKLAGWYSARKRGSYEFRIQLPAILDLLGDLRGKSLIDVGCGPGAYSIEFAGRGADVLGVDISRKMLEKAKSNAKTTNTTVALQKADLHSLPYADGSFDVAVLILTILNSRIVEETARVLKPGGLLLFSDTHPIIESKGRWERDDIGAGRIVEDYFLEDKREWRIKPGSRGTITLKYHARTIERCVNLIADAGFKILRIAEPKPGEDVRKNDQVHYDRCSRVPFFIIYLAERNP